MLRSKEHKIVLSMVSSSFCVHTILSHINEWHILPYGLKCPVKIWTSLPISANPLSQLLCCNLIYQPLLFQAYNQCAAVGQQPDVSNTPPPKTFTNRPQSFVMSSSSTDTIHIIASSHILWNSIFTKYPIIQHYIKWATENVREIWKWSKSE